MPLDFARARPLLQSCNLARLFVEELGWEPCRQKLTLRAGQRDHAFVAVAEKRGFTAWLCDSADGRLPDHTTRLKLDRALAQTSFEHLIVFATPDRSRQSWMWVRREPGRPLSARTHEFSRGQPGDSLLQKLQHLFVSLEEEEAGLSVAEIAGRVRAAFDLDRVTKAFYRDFDTHRKAFLKFIEGIKDVADCQWYASVMLNRLMFVYFIQRKGFLDGDAHYLRNRLQRTRAEHGKDKFYSFYRYFLLRLFHEGLGGRKRTADLEQLIGRIPYLNGGMFDKHPIEERYDDIQIADKAFERVFDYFDQYQWHLDERPLKNDKEINPDVLGYIFEKYINQKQMGAYYTKEDITEYISKNTVIPFLFDKVAQASSLRSGSGSEALRQIWQLLREDPDRYIYPAVRHGIDKPLPPDIAAGVKDVSKRTNWNKPAPGEYALPTEIWREVVARRQRCEEVRKKLTAGEVRDINDLITLNLDIRQFAQDVIVTCQDPALLAAFWHGINSITVLDPTGGSGAFVFAALNILEPLYEACLDRMEVFLAEWGEQGRKLHPNYHKEFTEVLARVAQHPNRRYFVLKSIIVNNLYAVDIMEEATEICKLRLFLKLAAQIDPDPAKENLGIEPLPDIDFNIRTGNTLVGYATANEVRRCMTGERTKGQDQMRLGVMGEKDAYAAFEDKLQIADAAFRSFREQQTKLGGAVTAEDKAALKAKLKSLEDELNRYLARDYGVNPGDRTAYAKWLKSHQPFHWLIEFYGIISKGGFDVIIGNPPYVETKNIEYCVRGFETDSCGDLYALCMERSSRLLKRTGRLGIIIPVSIVSTDGFAELRTFLRKHTSSAWTLSFAERPSKLFTGVEKRLTIWLSRHGPEESTRLLLSSYRRWAAEERDFLFAQNQFVPFSNEAALVGDSIPKIRTRVEAAILGRLSRETPLEAYFTGASQFVVFYTRKLRYFVQFFDFVPIIKDSKGKKLEPSELKDLYLRDEAQRDVALAILNSSLFFWFFCAYSDVRNVNRREIMAFRCSLDKMTKPVVSKLRSLSGALMKDFDRNSRMLTGNYGSYGVLQIQSFQPRLSKPILDEIDRVLAAHYGFTAEELDFILNYDIKYRLGRDAENENEE